MKRRLSNHTPTAQILIGLFVIGMGLLFLLDNLGWLDFQYSLHFLPMMLVFFGILKIVQTRTPQGLLVGGALVLAGVVLTLRSMGLFYISWRTIWPLLLIGLGIHVVFRSVTAQRQAGQGGTPGVPLGKPDDDSVVNITAVMGGFNRRIVHPAFKGGEITAVMGGCELDLRQASVEQDAVLNVFAMFGGIQIKVPPDWTIVMQGTPIMGGFDEKTILPPNGQKRLFIRGYAIMGGVEVRN